MGLCPQHSVSRQGLSTPPSSGPKSIQKSALHLLAEGWRALVCHALDDVQVADHWQPLLQEVVRLYQQTCDNQLILIGVYLRGSVPQGCAVPGLSDLDCLALAFTAEHDTLSEAKCQEQMQAARAYLEVPAGCTKVICEPGWEAAFYQLPLSSRPYCGWLHQQIYDAAGGAEAVRSAAHNKDWALPAEADRPQQSNPAQTCRCRSATSHASSKGGLPARGSWRPGLQPAAPCI